MRACPSCGASNSPTDDFCGNCGAYLAWSDPKPAPSTPAESEPAPSTPPEPPAAPDPAPQADPVPQAAPAPTEEPASAGPARTRPADRNHDEASEASAPGTPNPRSATTPGRPETPHSPPPAEPDDVRTGTRAPRAPSGAGPAASGPSARPPGPRPPATPEPSAPDPVLPVQPAKPVAPRPVVRPVAEPDEGAGAPCPACGTPNPPGRRFCRRCATPLNPVAKPAPLPWWRTVWPLRRRVRASSGRAVRLVVILAVVAALCAAGLLLLPAGRALFEDTRDKLGKPRPVTPVAVEASAEVPGHPAKNTTDGASNRYWGAPAPGASVTYTFRKPFRLVDLIITNGPSKSPDDYPRQARALRVDLEVTTQDGEQHRKQLTLGDKPGPQPVHTGISDVKTVRLVLHAPVGLTRGRHLALAEVEFFERG